MDILLRNLDFRVTIATKILLVGLVVVTTLTFLVTGYVLHVFWDLNPVTTHLMGWFAWFVWQGAIFPANRAYYLRSRCSNAYKKAFFREILFGASFGLAQMMRPAFLSILYFSPVQPLTLLLISGIVLTFLGLLLLYLGFRTIGFDGAGFLYEFRDMHKPLRSESVYAYIRHPLFFGGVLVSVGTGIFFLLPTAWWLAGVNIAILPLYRRLEDWRDTLVNGQKNHDYMQKVGAFLPKPNLVRKAFFASS